MTGHPLCSPATLCFSYDALVCALGWRFDTSIFGDGGKEFTQSREKDEDEAMTSVPRLNFPFEMDIARPDKYPAMTAHYESSNVPGLFFAGGGVPVQVDPSVDP